jgi:CheY-like chemotaxis protein
VDPKPLVFVVDDDDDTRSCVCSVLEEEGYGVACAKNGQDALEQLKRISRPNLVLLDLMMPVMSGWDVLDELRKNPALAALPVVVFTAAGESGVNDRGLQKPVLRKPIDLDLLLEMVNKICEAGWTIDEPPSDLLPKMT